VLRLLNGESASTIPVATGAFIKPVFDWRALKRWNVSEQRLPPGSEIRFREATVWEQYRWQLSTTFAVVLFQAAMIAWLLFERRRRSLAETEARNRRREVIHLNRVATATVLSSSIAHELSQPLGSILINAETAREMLRSVPPDLGQVDEILSDVIRDDQRAGEIVHNQKTLLKKEKDARLQLFDLNDSVREVVDIAAFEATKRGVALSAGRSPEALPVRADRIQMQQVMLNLVMNGMDALESCDRAARKVIIHASRRAASRAVEVTVADSGEGIPEDKLTSIFDPFFTTKPQGTGLGLPIARTIIETHGGTIWAENRVGGGAAFHFTLPLADASPG
jgi:signal transduction histidine kinase